MFLHDLSNFQEKKFSRSLISWEAIINTVFIGFLTSEESVRSLKPRDHEIGRKIAVVEVLKMLIKFVLTAPRGTTPINSAIYWPMA